MITILDDGIFFILESFDSFLKYNLNYPLFFNKKGIGLDKEMVYDLFASQENEKFTGFKSGKIINFD